MRECESRKTKCEVISLQIANIETSLKRKSLELKSSKNGNLIHTQEETILKVNFKQLKSSFHQFEILIKSRLEFFNDLRKLMKKYLKYNSLKSKLLQNESKLTGNIETLQTKTTKLSQSSSVSNLKISEYGNKFHNTPDKHSDNNFLRKKSKKSHSLILKSHKDILKNMIRKSNENSPEYCICLNTTSNLINL